MSSHFLSADTTASPELILKPLLHALGEHGFVLGGIVSLILIVSILRLPNVRGMLGEAKVRRALSRLDQDRYRVLHNVFVPSRSGEGSMTEVDHVIVSAFGIFVIETKHYSGWIYGHPDDTKWTRTNFRHKQSFLSPLKQNQGHINALACFLDLPRSKFHSIVCFTGDATLKTPLPANVLTSGMRRHIESHQDVLLEDAEVGRVWERLKSHDSGMHKQTIRRQHVARLAAMARH
jgi:hypothetical protein